MKQCNNKTKKLDEIHRNLYEIRTDFVRISHCLNIHRNSFERNSHEIRTNFVRISREFRPIFH